MNQQFFVRETSPAGRFRYRPADRLEVTRHAADLILYDLKRKGPALSSPDAVRRFLRTRLYGLEHEVFGVIWLDNRNRVIHAGELFRGTIDGASVHPREVVKDALTHNAASCLLYHNHPSGIPEPSQADEVITRRLKSALALIDVRIVDHLIIADGAEPVSFAERGII